MTKREYYPFFSFLLNAKAETEYITHHRITTKKKAGIRYHGRPKVSSRRERGLPSPAPLMKKKLVPRLTFMICITMSTMAKKGIMRTSFFTSGLNPPASSRTGYMKSRACTVKLWMVMRLRSGSIVHEQKSSAAAAAGRHKAKRASAT